MAADRGQQQFDRLHTSCCAEARGAKSGKCQTTTQSKQHCYRLAATNSSFCISTSLILVSLFAIALSASFAQKLRPQSGYPPSPPHTLHPLLSQSAGLDARGWPPGTQYAAKLDESADSSSAAEPEEAEVDQLLLARLNAARQMLEDGWEGDTLGDRGPRYELLREQRPVSPVDLLTKLEGLAKELQLAKHADNMRAQADDGRAEFKMATNPMYYSVSQDDVGSADNEFLGQFGKPLIHVQQENKRQAAGNKAREPRAKFTTLLEDEERTDDEASKEAQPNSEVSTQSPTTTVSYGRVLTAGEPLRKQTEGNSASSLLGPIYERLAAFWPASWNWWDSDEHETSSISEPSRAAHEGAKRKQVRTNSGQETGVASVHADRSGEAKQGVSEANSSDPSQIEANEAQTRPAASKLIRLRLHKMSDKQELGDELVKRVHAETPDELDLDEMWTSQQQQADDQVELQDGSSDKAASYVRHSGLVLPADDSLMTKYVYAPTQHYYLGPMDGQSHRLQPGDHVYGSAPSAEQWTQPRPAYAYDNKQQERSYGQLMNGTSRQLPGNNDLYFLVMVGAFCVMAMAVVLAAGLFAYRVQQNRKSSQAEQEYPTYGVVGPNNMLGAKCGAAAFMGGYFANNHGGTGGSAGAGGAAHLTGSKSGSTRHLPDLYAHGLSHGPGSDSGLASLDKVCSSKKSSAASSADQTASGGLAAAATVQQQRQSANFMTSAMANSQDAARMYHYQHQKQQMIVSERSSAGRHTSASDLDSEDENDDGSYTVYECPGLASAHEMEIKNPLFNDERSP